MTLTRPAAFTAVLCLCAFLARGAARAEDRPLLGIAVLRNNSPRTAALTVLLENNLLRIAESTALFRAVNPALLREQLGKFGCTDERCVLGFARDAGMSLVIRGDFDDASDFILLSLHAYGIDIPYQNRAVQSYTVRIPMKGKFGAAEYNAITEEHAARFISKLLAGYRSPVYAVTDADGTLSFGWNLNGTYDIYRPEPPREKNALRGFRKTGSALLASGAIIRSDPPLQAGDFVLAGFRDKADYLEKFFYERKRETVFRPPAWANTIYAVLLTGPASAFMPVIAPTLGYYRASDWQGLALWTFNFAPYFYLEINGMADYWANYYKKKKTVPRDVQAQYYFGLYMLCAGGASLFADSFAHDLLEKAANYQGVQPFMGSAVTAGYLALISGGGGHFYRGSRLWGYLYFHADNLLLFFTIREFCPEKKYLPLLRSFSTEKINRTRAYALLSATCAVKLAEVVHAVLIRDAIRNGEIIDEGYAVEPVLFGTEDAGVTLGMRCSYRW
ncbi:MAG: hypothetical protein A2176_11350 [Spirochaetes bacterium RBG_13_51_14]|nr:MAG: hypothetical protein A2176_11350 [Spirochaetes bacterium RBG_13_51_14]